MTHAREALLVFVACAAAVGCAPKLPDAQVERDFRTLLASTYPDVEIAAIESVEVHDGWGDGAEFVVTFRSRCAGAQAPSLLCAPGIHAYSMSYQLTGQSGWTVIGHRVLDLRRAPD